MPLHEYDLIAESTLGVGPSDIKSRVSAGTAVSSRISADRDADDDPDLALTLRMYSSHDYYLLAFVCSFLEREGERIDGATKRSSATGCA